MRKKVLVPIADGFEEIETVTVVDMLRRAPLDVTLAGLHAGPLRGSRRIMITPDCLLSQALSDDYDMLVLPGGIVGVNHMKEDLRVIELVKKMADQHKWIAAICAAPLILKEADLITNLKLTSHPSVQAELKESHYLNERVVVDGKYITSRGPGTAMEFSLKLIEVLWNKDKAMNVADLAVAAITCV